MQPTDSLISELMAWEELRVQCGDLGLRLGLRMLGFGLILFPRNSTTTPMYVCFLKLVYSKS